MSTDRPRVIVIGGGIAGLAAACRLAGPSHRGDGGVGVTLLESSTRLGGKIDTAPFAGRPLDTGPDAFLTRTPPALELCRTVGLGNDDLVAPAAGAAYLWSRRRLRRLPEGLVLGVPTDLVALARSGVLAPSAAARVALDLILPARHRPPGDISVADLIRPRLGSEAAFRLVDAIVGGINAGRTEELSAAVVAPQLAAAAQHRSVILGARAAQRASRETAAAGAAAAPVFLTVRGGLGRLVEAIEKFLRSTGRAEVCLGEGAAALTRAASGRRWIVTTTLGRTLRADAVLITVPAPSAADLLEQVCPGAAGDLRAIRYSSVALVTMAYPRAAVAHPLDGSGFLVPRVEGRLMTACSWVNAKWPHLGYADDVVLRVSAGRAGDDRALALDDDVLVDRLHDELTEAMGITARPVEARVHRWRQAFPQYPVGHLDRVARVEASLAATSPGVLIAGAAYRGVGLPTCIAGAEAAAEQALAVCAGRSGRDESDEP